MFIKSQFTTLFDYHWYTNQILMDSAAKLTEADYYRNPENSPDSIHEILFHILRADHGWLKAIQTGGQQLPISENEYPDLVSLKTGFKNEQTDWSELLSSLTEDEIKTKITLTRLNGDEMVFLRWRILQHVIIHGMQHHSEIAQLLTFYGQSPGDIDFLFFQ